MDLDVIIPISMIFIVIVFIIAYLCIIAIFCMWIANSLKTSGIVWWSIVIVTWLVLASLLSIPNNIRKC